MSGTRRSRGPSSSRSSDRRSSGRGVTSDDAAGPSTQRVQQNDVYFGLDGLPLPSSAFTGADFPQSFTGLLRMNDPPLSGGSTSYQQHPDQRSGACPSDGELPPDIDGAIFLAIEESQTVEYFPEPQPGDDSSSQGCRPSANDSSSDTDADDQEAARAATDEEALVVELALVDTFPESRMGLRGQSIGLVATDVEADRTFITLTDGGAFARNDVSTIVTTILKRLQHFHA